MFEQRFDDMFADVWFDNREVALASEEGVGEFSSGYNCVHSLDALVIIRKYDRALKGNHYAAKRNRLLACRNSMVMAFGPEMKERVGFAS